ncbi:hypothetical protein [Prevotella sp. 10(H)]|uniref:hypothetical protein n=1 Tax=Prevotella sp. 10(H) TaxID=1158294 RepID=UPI0004A76EEF|nr:hypothetical protein [Prevotella sp. 10(H)]
MAVKQNSPTSKKEGEITRQERSSVNQQAELTLREIKEKKGDVILIAISSRTTIELPAHLSQAERDARVANYIRLHASKI